jgi:hypothetical protein
VYRTLKSEGAYLVIDVVPDPGGYDKQINDLFIDMERDRTGHVKFYTLAEYEEFARQVHFSLTEIECFPLVLDFPNGDPYYAAIKEMPEEFKSMICFREHDGRFSFTLKAAGVYLKKRDKST